MRNDDIGPGCVTPSALALIPSLCVSGFVAVFTYGLVSDWWRWSLGSFFVVFGSTYAMLMAQYRSLWLAREWPDRQEQEQTVDRQPVQRVNHWQEIIKADLQEDAISLAKWSIEKYSPQGNIILSAAEANLNEMSGRRWDEITNAMRDKSLIVKVSRQPTVVSDWIDNLGDLRAWLVDNPLSPTG